MNLQISFAVALFFCLAFDSVSGKGKGKGHDDEKGHEGQEIGKIVCTPAEWQKTSWFKCIECCQSINAYHLKHPDKECNREARGIFCKNPDLNVKTRSKVCIGMKAYNAVLKKVVLDLKGHIRAECVTAEGMEKLFGEKVDCFRACDDQKYDHAIIKKWCPHYKP